MSSPLTKAITVNVSDKFSIKSFGAHFVPKDCRQIKYGSETLMVYPKIDSTMPLSEKAHAFNVNRAAIEASNLNPTAKIQATGNLHNCDTIANIIRNRWEQIAFDSARDPQAMTISSYNTLDGAIINNPFQPTTKILLDVPAGNCAVDKCRPDGIAHMKVNVITDFSSIYKKKKITIKFNTFLRLHQDAKTVKNTAGTDRELFTYTGPSNILNLPAKDFTDLIFEHDESIDDPYELDQASFSSRNAFPNSEKKRKEILSKIHQAALDPISEAVFESICPNFLDDPERSFNQIKQLDTDHSHTVTEYYAVAMALLNNFRRGRDVKWQNDPAAHFVNNLRPEIVVEMEKCGYKHHLGGASVDPFDQIGLMAVAYKHAIIAENSITSTKN